MHSEESLQLTEQIIYCVLKVHRALGPGFLEKVYRAALRIELRKQNLTAEVEKPVLVYYEGQKVGRHRLDFLVNGKVIVELKTVESLGRAHYAQVRSYLKATGLQLGLLVNFADDGVDFRRVECRTKRAARNPLKPKNESC